MSTRVLIVEDEFPIALNIEFLLKKWGHEVTGIAKDADTARKIMSETNPQLIILDIHLKGKSTGIDLARSIIEKDDIPFIYLTAYTDKKTFGEASKTYPFAFLAKPFKEEELKRTIELAINQHEKSKEKLNTLTKLFDQLHANDKKKPSIFFAREGNKVRKINMYDLKFIRSLDNYVEFHMDSETVIVHESLNRLEKKLSKYSIIRVHRSYMVALSAIQKIEEDVIVVDTEKQIPVSRSYKKTLLEKLEWL